jgi:hypothetical protein
MKKSLIIKVRDGGVTVDIAVCCIILGIMLDNCNSFDSIVVVVVIVINKSKSEKRIEFVIFIVLIIFVFL